MHLGLSNVPGIRFGKNSGEPTRGDHLLVCGPGLQRCEGLQPPDRPACPDTSSKRFPHEKAGLSRWSFQEPGRTAPAPEPDRQILRQAVLIDRPLQGVLKYIGFQTLVRTPARGQVILRRTEENGAQFYCAATVLGEASRIAACQIGRPVHESE